LTNAERFRAAADGAVLTLCIRAGASAVQRDDALAGTWPVTTRATSRQVVRWYVACTDIDDRKRAESDCTGKVALREEIDKTSMFEEIVGGSPALTAVCRTCQGRRQRFDGADSPGETGPARTRRAGDSPRSRRASRGFVPVKTVRPIPRDLIASELFGHEKGAFTGALQRGSVGSSGGRRNDLPRRGGEPSGHPGGVVAGPPGT